MTEKELVWYSGRCQKCGAQHLSKYELVPPKGDGKIFELKPVVGGRIWTGCIHADYSLWPVSDGVMVVW